MVVQVLSMQLQIGTGYMYLILLPSNVIYGYLFVVPGTIAGTYYILPRLPVHITLYHVMPLLL